MSEVSTKLRNVEMDRITIEELRGVASLSADWDTLGWVHFQKGNTDLAEKYITAAWRLGEHGEVGQHLGEILEKRGNKEEAIAMYARAVVADRRVPESRESLERLAGKERSAALIKQAEEESRDSRTVKLGPVAKNLKAMVQGAFFVVLVPGPSRVAQVAEVKFISGDERLKPLSAALKTANYNLVFPDEARTKVIRRGTLFCQPNGECSFFMMSPDLVFSVD